MKGLIKRLVGKPAFWITFLVIAMALPIGRSLARRSHQLPPVLGTLKNFTLRNQDGDVVTLNSLRGKVLLVNFIFTSCPDACPLITQQMVKIQKHMSQAGTAVKLLSISVDPETDTPDTLKAYGIKYGADFKIWNFLTGPLHEVEKTVVQGFKLAMDQQKKPNDPNPSLMDITHGEHFVIVDQIGRIRAYHRANNTEQINTILKEINLLMNSDPSQFPALAR